MQRSTVSENDSERGPDKIVRWMHAFCSERTASTQSPVAYLFFNADLVQRRIDANGGAIAFIDDYTAGVTGPTALDTRRGIEAIVEGALNWERRSGAMFEADKVAIIHFTRDKKRMDMKPFLVKEQLVKPKEQVKILGVIMDMRLK